MCFKKFVFWSLLICNILSILISADRCSSQYCNFAGVCRLVKNSPRCRCYTEAFNGKFCEEVKDLCSTTKNTCLPSQLCMPYVGQVVCGCQPEISMKECKLDMPLCSYNVQVEHGVLEPIVLSFGNLKARSLQITVSTSNNLIAHIPRPAIDKSQHTSNLTSILHQLGIRRHIKPPYDDAHYYIFNATYTNPGPTVLKVTIEFDTEGRKDSSNSIKTLSVVVHVLKPRYCVPRILFQHCMDIDNPRKIDSQHFCNLQAILEDRCSASKPILQTQWSVYNYEDPTRSYLVVDGEKLFLKIPRYALWKQSLLNYYPNLIVAVQLSVKEKNGPWGYATCYLNLTARNVIAKIAGGQYRQIIDNTKWLFLDGSLSREPGQYEHDIQSLTYTWSVRNANESEELYLSKDNSNPTLTVPRSVLKSSLSIITLKVTNKFAKARTNSVDQSILIINDSSLHNVQIECIRNCQDNFFVVNQKLHLRAVCRTCMKPISYTWSLNNVTSPQHKKRLITKVENDHLIDKLLIFLDVMNNGKNIGHAQLSLTKAYPPEGEGCSIKGVGKECTTRFHISCMNYTTKLHDPILYTFRLGNFYMDNINSGETFLYLNGRGALTVHICSCYLACTTVSLAFEAKTLQSNDTPNLSVMFMEGRRQQVFCFLQLFSFTPEKMITFVDSDDPWEHMETVFALEMVNSLEIATNCIANLKSLGNPDIRVVSFMMGRVLSNYNYISSDNEILDLTEVMWLDMSKLLTHMVTYCMIPDDSILKLNSFLKENDDPTKEVYTNWTDLDDSIVLRISHMAAIVKGIFVLWRRVGEKLTSFIQPGEPFDYAINEVSLKVKMHAAYMPIRFVSKDEYCYIKSPLKTVSFLRKNLNTKYLLIYSWCLKYDFLWWVPGVTSPNSVSMAVNIFGRNVNNNLFTEKATELATYSIGLERISTQNKYYYKNSNVVLYHALIYSVKLPGKVNLVVKLLSSSDFRVLITMHVKPVQRKHYDQSIYVPKDSYRKKIILRNHCSHESIAYIAISKTNLNDSTPANITVHIRAQHCSVYDINEDDPTWRKVEFRPNTFEQNPNFSNCQVHYLSVFSARAYRLQPFEIQQLSYDVYVPPVCTIAVIFYCIMILVIVGLLIFVTLLQRYRRKNLIRVIKSKKDEEDPSTENVIVHLRTGGGLLSFTTANVTLRFVSDLGRYKVVIYQNPVHPNLGLNTACMIRLSDTKVRLPCRLTISHDMSGRYPSWFCRSIQVDDLRNDISYTFPLNCWIRRDQKIMVTCFPEEKKKVVERLYRLKHTKGFILFFRRFRYYSRLYFTDWFMFQPIFGPWRYTDESLNVYQRTCIWICKTIITITVVFCFYRRSTFYNINNFNPHFELLDIPNIMALSLGSYTLVLILNYCLDHMSLP